MTRRNLKQRFARIAANKSSTITPNPPGSSCDFFIKGNFTMSKKRNKKKPTRRAVIRCPPRIGIGIKQKVISIPTNSSIVIFLASLPQIFSKSLDKNTPIMKRATVDIKYITGNGYSNRINGIVINEAKVAGANGIKPVPRTLPTIIFNN